MKMKTFSVATILIALQQAISISKAIEISKIPEECRDKNFCMARGSSYPETSVTRLQPVMKSLMVPLISSEPGYRIGCGDVTECEVKEYQRAPIYYIKDQQGKWRVVIQITNSLEQIFDVVECRKPGKIDYDTKNFPLVEAKDKFSCEDIYIQYEFYVLSADEKGIDKVYSAGEGIPVCCACKMKGDYEEMYENY